MKHKVEVLRKSWHQKTPPDPNKRRRSSRHSHRFNNDGKMVSISANKGVTRPFDYFVKIMLLLNAVTISYNIEDVQNITGTWDNAAKNFVWEFDGERMPTALTKIPARDGNGNGNGNATKMPAPATRMLEKLTSETTNNDETEIQGTPEEPKQKRIKVLTNKEVMKLMLSSAKYFPPAQEVHERPQARVEVNPKDKEMEFHLVRGDDHMNDFKYRADAIISSEHYVPSCKIVNDGLDSIEVKFKVGMEFSYRDRDFVDYVTIAESPGCNIRIISVHKEVAKITMQGKHRQWMEMIVSRSILCLLGDSLKEGRVRLSLSDAVSNFQVQSQNCEKEYKLRTHYWENQCPCCKDTFHPDKSQQRIRWNLMLEHIQNEAKKETTVDEGKLYCVGSLDKADIFEKHKFNLAFFEEVLPLFNSPHSNYEMKFGFDCVSMNFDPPSMEELLKFYENKLKVMMTNILMQYTMPVECAAVYILGMNKCSEQLVKYLQTLALAAERYVTAMDFRSAEEKLKEIDPTQSIHKETLQKMLRGYFNDWVKANFKQLERISTTPALLTMYYRYTEYHDSYTGTRDLAKLQIPYDYALERDKKFYLQLHLVILGWLPAKKKDTKKEDAKK